MSDASHLGLGRIIPGSAPYIRDAIHIAVVPVIADEELKPGTKVRLVDIKVGLHDVAIAANERPYLGVVDPYLQSSVQRGERFWLYLNPGSIRGLRHEWTHPAFDKEQA